MHAIAFLQDLAVVMMVAGLVTIIFHRLKQPVVLGYIIAGVIIGPHTPPFPLINDEESIKTLAELGIIFLMFSLGLEFNLRKLKQVGAVAFIAALSEIVLMVWAGYEIGRLFGWTTMDSIFLGAMLSVSSTTIIIKALGELGKTKEKFAELVFGILIIEDILAILMIALLSTFAAGSLSFTAVAITTGKLGIFLTVSLVLGLIMVPRLLGFVAGFKSNEVLLITVLGLCFGFSLLAVKLGYSIALGAFLIGAIIAEARHIHKIETLTEPIRDMFSAVFFVAIGLLIEPQVLMKNAWPIAIITLVVVVGKVLSCSFGTFVSGKDTRTSLRVGMSLAQIGEFSFIIASLGLTLKVTSDFLYPIAVAVSVLTTLFTPYLIKSSDSLTGWFDRVAPRSMVDTMTLYTKWVGQLGNQRHASMATRLLRKWILQMTLNITLIAGLFIAAAFFAHRSTPWLPELFVKIVGAPTFLWMAAMLCSMPLFIATFRKLQAMGMLLAETRGSKSGSREHAVVANGIPLAGIVILALLTMALSATILPPFRILIFLLGIIALVTILFWRFFIKIYSKAQIALQETFQETALPKHEVEPVRVPSILKEANLETTVIEEKSLSANKMLREVELRSKTGASVVGIERSGSTIINPGPDEELVAGDHVLLLGNRTQLDAAKKLLKKS